MLLNSGFLVKPRFWQLRVSFLERLCNFLNIEIIASLYFRHIVMCL